MGSCSPVSFAVDMRGITKRYPRTFANDAVDFSVRRGTIHALIGENGAGKSTLMKILAGLVRPDSGTLQIEGAPLRPADPAAALSRGIGMVQQQATLIPRMTVAENIILGAEPRWGPFILRRRAARKVEALCRDLDLDLEPDRVVEHLSMGERHRVELLKVLYRGSRIVILDEPTTMLVPQERDALFDRMLRLRAQGITLILITHKLPEVAAIADRVTVMRQGRTIGEWTVRDTTEEALAEAMIGRGLLPLSPGRPSGKDDDDTEPALIVDRLCTNQAHSVPLDRVSFSIRAGEILGLAGVAGNGQSELVGALTGRVKPRSGEIHLRGRNLAGLSPKEIRDAGTTHIPEEGPVYGLMPDHSIAENLILGIHRRPQFGKRWGLDPALIQRHAASLIAEFDIRPSVPETPAATLSGGNQQRVIAAREISQHTSLLLAAHPTRGLDLKSAQFIHQRLRAEQGRGAAILLISFDLEELFVLCDRVLVMYQGRITGTVRPHETAERELGLLMTGVGGVGRRA